MAQLKWQLIETLYCEHVGEEVVLQTDMVFPPECVTEKFPQVLARHCSNETMCNQFDRTACVWCSIHLKRKLT